VAAPIQKVASAIAKLAVLAAKVAAA